MYYVRSPSPATGAIAVLALVLTGLGLSGQSTAVAAPPTLTSGYPRLSMWWPNTDSQPLSSIARWDLTVITNPSKTSQTKALNPDMVILTDTNSYQRRVTELSGTSARWLLTQIGTTLTGDVSPTATSLPVASTAGLFGVGEYAVVDGEMVKITAIGATTLTVQRGVAWTATAHASGARIAAAVSTYPGAVNFDVTSYCPTVNVGAGPETWAQYNARTSAAKYAGAAWDGLYIDACEPKRSWNVGTGTVRSIDLDRSNRAVTDSYAALDAAWKSGMASFCSNLRARVGSAILIGNGSQRLYGVLNGSLFESFPQARVGDWGYQNWKQTVFGPGDDTDLWSDRYVEWGTSALQPNVTTLLAYEDETGAVTATNNPFLQPGFIPNYRKMRFGLTTTLLGNGFYSYEMGSSGLGALGLMWFDEYDNAGRGTGYLGQPTGAAYRATPTLPSPDLLCGDGAFDTSAQLSAWRLLQNGTTYRASVALDGGGACVNVTAAAGAYNGVQLTHPIALTSATDHTLTFRAKAERPTTLQVWSSQQLSPWATRLSPQWITLTPEWQTFILPTKASAADAGCYLQIGFGQTATRVWIDDFKVQQGTQEVYRRDFENGTALVNARNHGARQPGRHLPQDPRHAGSDGQRRQPRQRGHAAAEGRDRAPARGGDTTAPSVSITSPATGAVVSGLVNIAALAADNVGVTSVEFRVDGTLVLSDTTAPYAATWDATGATAGAHRSPRPPLTRRATAPCRP